MTLEGSNYHQMVPNLKCKGMVSLITSQYGIWKLCIIIYTYTNLFCIKVKQCNFTRKLCSNPPKGDSQAKSPNQVKTSQISKKSMGVCIKHELISLTIFINLFKCLMICNICRVTFIEIA